MIRPFGDWVLVEALPDDENHQFFYPRGERKGRYTYEINYDEPGGKINLIRVRVVNIPNTFGYQGTTDGSDALGAGDTAFVLVDSAIIYHRGDYTKGKYLLVPIKDIVGVAL